MSGRLCRCNDFLALLLSKGRHISSFRNLVVVARVLDIRTIAAVDYLNVAFLIFSYNSAGFFSDILFNEFDAGIEIHLQRVSTARQRNVLVSILDVRTEFSLGTDDVGSVVLANCSWQFKELESLI